MSTDHVMDCDDPPDVGGSKAADVAQHADNAQPGDGVQPLPDSLKQVTEPATSATGAGVTDAYATNCSAITPISSLELNIDNFYRCYYRNWHRCIGDEL